jgi:hypothetical protein
MHQRHLQRPWQPGEGSGGIHFSAVGAVRSRSFFQSHQYVEDGHFSVDIGHRCGWNSYQALIHHYIISSKLAVDLSEHNIDEADEVDEMTSINPFSLAGSENPF